ncbi:MAG: CBS domain-containing protein [Candidatus Cloacimonetes bacterium]|jgi:CBS domain-containing protein|nr:CBS domain-containing protein [Candidatus Cloacimonadota bacterium]MBT6993734.1 CBS domain-containing protein [Candidatus Cloacimonadota bacterium]MBT7469776.1 CBS domain-containing protein [Candidatus Cloacimonadota bacterium]
MKERVSEVFKKHNKPVTIKPESTISEVVSLLNHHQIGCVVVMNEECIMGIISERDILAKLGKTNTSENIHQLKVSDVMTQRDELIVGNPEDTVEYLMNVMTEKQIRHIPIVIKGCNLIQLISMRDIVRVLLKDSKMKIKYLTDYMQGTYI